MTINDLINKAAEGYTDSQLLMYWTGFGNRAHFYDNPDGGDGLARFIVLELSETFDPEACREDQLAEAVRVMTNASRDVQGVIEALQGGADG